MDFNVDAGEGYKNEEVILPYITACNIACGGHAGSEGEMHRVVKLCKEFGVKIGAHPSYPDKAHFGRKSLKMSRKEFLSEISPQIEQLRTICHSQNVTLSHIKPHGALYHDLSRNIELANQFVELILNIDKTVAIVGFPNSDLEKASTGKLTFVREGFADRVYTSTGELTSRNEEHSLLHNPSEILDQINLLTKGIVRTNSGEEIAMQVDTICFHGDHEGAAETIKKVMTSINS